MSIGFYKSLKRAKGKMILEALELAGYGDGKTERVQMERKLTIEQLMTRFMGKALADHYGTE
jgi:hypothetical protein